MQVCQTIDIVHMRNMYFFCGLWLLLHVVYTCRCRDGYRGRDKGAVAPLPSALNAILLIQK